ncbi:MULTISPECIES: DNA-binding transcriptional regulator CsiR [unclassified Cocleimonas]|uniref:DNA-binding transcriptional regulator CsiR n=1 Tax=unclassified Cocleimonas TaxID=2639732 RepID=UPI0026392650|nr:MULTISPECIES: DNA-binding transcriptional regulator CsiR [unclassified Cocleimonas]MEB8432684.1 DNA-binding transcriptional regulator CsiR [Cocleimonas sp. KMM 6892]MEC4715543.1 DNA-binding transcriptional regulator CsiR [Cocleimonas sp. KMM 6895]MEC4744839.1 DNA-binding transcriptional regulator CsiR [Cocleimonas sp. KMM 6896]
MGSVISSMTKNIDKSTAKPIVNPSETTDSFSSQVLQQLKGDILSGYFAPGEKLKMAILKERYAVGISPLREALSQLLVEQLVVVENQRGFKVHPISLAEMIDIYQTRSHIEALCVELAIANGNDEWEASIVAANHLLKKSGELLEKTDDDVQQWEAIHQKFHTAIASGCGSATLLQVRRSLYEKASRYRNLWLKKNMSDHGVYDANRQEHDDLVEALLDRNQEKAIEIIKQHLLIPSLLLQESKPSLF